MKLTKQQERRKEYLIDTLRHAMAEKEGLIPKTSRRAPVIAIDSRKETSR